jgi:hypothetical protein
VSFSTGFIALHAFRKAVQPCRPGVSMLAQRADAPRVFQIRPEASNARPAYSGFTSFSVILTAIGHATINTTKKMLRT